MATFMRPVLSGSLFTVVTETTHVTFFGFSDLNRACEFGAQCLREGVKARLFKRDGTELSLDESESFQL